MAFILQPESRTMEEMMARAGTPVIWVQRAATATATFTAFHAAVQQAQGVAGCSVISEPFGLVMVDGNGVRVETPGGCCVLWHSDEPGKLFCFNGPTKKMGVKVTECDLTRAVVAVLDVSALNQVSQ